MGVLGIAELVSGDLCCLVGVVGLVDLFFYGYGCFFFFSCFSCLVCFSCLLVWLISFWLFSMAMGQTDATQTEKTGKWVYLFLLRRGFLDVFRSPFSDPQPYVFDVFFFF